MDRIILIETSTSLCSTALVEGSGIVSYKESTEQKSQASITAPFIKEMLDERGLTARDCSAVCLSMGPGSYTGLRVGASTAKGLCFGADIPLIAVGTLETLVWQAIGESLVKDMNQVIVPMIDARRMEVYCAKFSSDARQLDEIEPKIIDSGSYSEELANGKVLFIGDGAGKCADVIKSENAEFVQCFPKASSMLNPALREYKEKRFKDLAYFEPFYLKQYIATISSKKLF